ncbi:hypothetical protein QBC47DRAFT_23078 [Echria macrotheca]|uniref:Uncharacterized protein n=1 Tax=Echria macrotheca TaxID=438768 RepID=A0AAJ0FFA2_9PEZI|nr:hypothetical protein QBC47DRAFT_23078 [Echria macrotheca]
MGLRWRFFVVDCRLPLALDLLSSPSLSHRPATRMTATYSGRTAATTGGSTAGSSGRTITPMRPSPESARKEVDDKRCARLTISPNQQEDRGPRLILLSNVGHQPPLPVVSLRSGKKTGWHGLQISPILLGVNPSTAVDRIADCPPVALEMHRPTNPFLPACALLERDRVDLAFPRQTMHPRVTCVNARLLTRKDFQLRPGMRPCATSQSRGRAREARNPSWSWDGMPSATSCPVPPPTSSAGTRCLTVPSVIQPSRSTGGFWGS